jgi:predicted PhzF superfamily epimerase YddE/YHI9
LQEILRYTAFSSDPAGVVLDATGASAVEMQRVAAEVGFSGTGLSVSTQRESL